jgi:hypothetical protein
MGRDSAIEPHRELTLSLQGPDPAFPVTADTISDLIRSDLLDRARRVVAVAKEGRSEQAYDLLEIDGHLALAEGRIDEAAQVLESLKDPSFPPGSPATTLTRPNAALRLAGALAIHWKTQGDLQAAITVLENTTRDQQRWKATILDDGGLALVYWIHARDELSELYRRTNRIEESEAIDAELLKLLAVADDDHPVLVRIKARQLK